MTPTNSTATTPQKAQERQSKRMTPERIVQLKGYHGLSELESQEVWEHLAALESELEAVKGEKQADERKLIELTIGVCNATPEPEELTADNVLHFWRQYKESRFAAAIQGAGELQP